MPYGPSSLSFVLNILYNKYNFKFIFNIIKPLFFFQWQVPLPLQSLLIGLPNGLFKFLVIILIAKSKEMIKLNVSQIINLNKCLIFLLCIHVLACINKKIIIIGNK